MVNQIDSFTSFQSRIGIITGSGPEAGQHFWRCLLEACRCFHGDKFQGDLDAPHVTILSDPRLGLSMDLDRYDSVVWEILHADLQVLAAQVDHLVITCYTLHRYINHIRSLDIKAQFISLETAIEAYLIEYRPKSVAVLRAGASAPEDCPVLTTVQSYTVAETLPDPNRVRTLIQAVKRQGGDQPEIIEEFAEILTTLDSETVLLACTELPLIPWHGEGKQIVDGMQLTAEKLIALTMGECSVKCEKSSI